MKRRFNIMLLIVGFLLLAATESETGISNIMGTGLCIISGMKLDFFEEIQ
jgi:hypothetical protein